MNGTHQEVKVKWAESDQIDMDQQVDVVVVGGGRRGAASSGTWLDGG